MTQYMQEARAMKQADEQREAFEAWADTQSGGRLRSSSSNDYDYPLGRLMWSAWQAALAAALPPAAVQAGWKLVPIEPTHAMVKVGTDARWQSATRNPDSVREIYAAMLAAVDEGTLTAGKQGGSVQRFMVTSIKHQAGIVTLVTINAEDVRDLESGQEVTLVSPMDSEPTK